MERRLAESVSRNSMLEESVAAMDRELASTKVHLAKEISESKSRKLAAAKSALQTKVIARNKLLQPLMEHDACNNVILLTQ